MKKTWVGKYFDINEKGTEDEYMFRIDVEMDEEMSFSGTVWEEEFYEKAELFLSVKGFIDQNHISFVKTYPCLFEMDENFNSVIDKSKKGHEVVYDGYWDENEKSWKGNWEIKGDVVFIKEDCFEEEIVSGPFEMRLVD